MAKGKDSAKAAARKAAREAAQAEAEAFKRAERRREKIRAWIYLALIAAVVLGLAYVAFLRPYLDDRAKENRIKNLALGSIGTSPSAAGCRPEEKVDISIPKSGWHVDPGTTLSYEDAPPSYGKHWSEFLPTGRYRTIFTEKDRPPKEQLVHSLEHGHTVLWYDETLAADETAFAVLQDIADKLITEDNLVIAPWTTSGDKPDGGAFPDGAHLALTHWAGSGDDETGVTQYCDGVSGAAVKAFMIEYPKSDSPEPDAP
ncbi:hypothetical protein ABIE44_003337 [Marmoricola sp. OAE513]|uniref:DUF3105 domain-containing protein n=1 Tax=Marmoricola sp. OAE513 TaxID=2817894 RepID=UPI001AE63A64